MREKTYYVYILASCMKGTLYIGITNDLLRRVREHKQGRLEGFTKKYRVTRLVYFAATSDAYGAITTEKRMKEWPRAKKITLIEKDNPGWEDLYFKLMGEDRGSRSADRDDKM